MSSKFFLLFLLCSSFVQAQLAPKFFPISDSGFETELPENWILRDDSMGLEVNSPSSDVMISFQSFPETELEQVLAGLDEMMKTEIEDLKPVAEPAMIELNGLQVMMSDAKGKINGVTVQIGVFLVPNKEQMLLIVGIARGKANSESVKGLEKVIGNLQLIKK